MCTAECRLMECISTTTVDMNVVQQLVTVEGGNYYYTTIACRTVECGTAERDGGRLLAHRYISRRPSLRLLCTGT